MTLRELEHLVLNQQKQIEELLDLHTVLNDRIHKLAHKVVELENKINGLSGNRTNLFP